MIALLVHFLITKYFFVQISTLDEQLKEKEKELQEHKNNTDKQISALQSKVNFFLLVYCSVH